MFKVRKIDINSSYELVALLKESDAKKLGLSPKERIKVTCTKCRKSIICELEIQECIENCSVLLKAGELGLLDTAFVKLHINGTKSVEIEPAPKPKSIEYVKKKFEGERLSQKEFDLIIEDIVSNKFSEVETTYFVLSCSAHKLDDKEVTYLTKAMVKVGRQLDFSEISDIIVDKHCIGGVPNNRTTMIVVPIVAAAGLTIPKTSSRSITSPSGTADTMEVLTKVDFGLNKLFHIVKDIGGCVAWGGSLDLSPADDVIIRVEHPLNIDSEGQMIASILSKKKTAGSTHVLIDIPVGATAKVRTNSHAQRLKKRFERIGKAVGLQVKVVLTDGSQPIGSGIGPALEATDVMKVLENAIDAPTDLREKALIMAGEILELAKVTKPKKGYDMAKVLLDSGRAFDKMREILKAQGGRKEIPQAMFVEEVKALKSGKILSYHNRRISKAAFILGAPQIKEAGIYLRKKVGDEVKKGDVLMEFHSNSTLKIKYAKKYIESHIDTFTLKK